jgi:hypothetical protein
VTGNHRTDCRIALTSRPGPPPPARGRSPPCRRARRGR